MANLSRIMGHSFQVVPFPGTAESGGQRFLMTGGNIIDAMAGTSVRINSQEFSVTEKSWLWLDTNNASMAINTSSTQEPGMVLVAVLDLDKISQHLCGDLFLNRNRITVSIKNDGVSDYASVKIDCYAFHWYYGKAVIDAEFKFALGQTKLFDIVVPANLINNNNFVKYGVKGGSTPPPAYNSDAFTTAAAITTTYGGGIAPWTIEKSIAEILLTPTNVYIYARKQTNGVGSTVGVKTIPLGSSIDISRPYGLVYDEGTGAMYFTFGARLSGAINIPANFNGQIFYDAKSATFNTTGATGVKCAEIKTRSDKTAESYYMWPLEEWGGYSPETIKVVTGVTFGSTPSYSTKDISISQGGRITYFG